LYVNRFQNDTTLETVRSNLASQMHYQAAKIYTDYATSTAELMLILWVMAFNPFSHRPTNITLAYPKEGVRGFNSPIESSEFFIV